MDEEDQLFELEYHDEMEMLAELENGKTQCLLRGSIVARIGQGSA